MDSNQKKIIRRLLEAQLKWTLTNLTLSYREGVISIGSYQQLVGFEVDIYKARKANL